MTYRSQAVPSYAAYGGVPEEEAYGGVSLEIGLSPAQRSAKIAERKKKLQEQQNIQSSVHNTAYSTYNHTDEKPVDYSLYGKGFSQQFINQMLNDTRFQRAMNTRTRINEGKYSNHPNDRGGETNFGITARYYPTENIKELTPERASAILYRDYWLRPNIYQLPDEFSDIVFDNSVVQGQPTAIMNLQKALNIKADGILGPQTFEALKNSNYTAIKHNFIANVHKIEDAYIKNDPSQKVFENGHRNRYNRYY